MKKVLFLLFIFPALQSLAQDNAGFFDPQAVAAVRVQSKVMHGSTLNSLFIAERFESQSNDGERQLLWEAQGWTGYDLNKLWIKTEGLYDSEANSTEELEFQALWSHALSSFWDLQLGWRHDTRPVESRDYAVIGLMGLAPYWFEVDAAAFISEQGGISSRVEAEYELRFSQRLILQPRVEFNYAFSDDLGIGRGKGLHGLHAGLRLRYEFRRELAPYLGVAWEKAYGDTGRMLQAAGQDNSEVNIVAGLRFWY